MKFRQQFLGRKKRKKHTLKNESEMGGNAHSLNSKLTNENKANTNKSKTQEIVEIVDILI